MLCKRCKKYIPDDSKLCCYCGSKISDMDKMLHRQEEKRNMINMQREISRSNKNSFQAISIPKSDKSKIKKRKKNKFMILAVFLAISLGFLIILYSILT